MVRFGSSSVLLGAVLLAGCAVGPNYKPAAPAVLGVPDAWSVPAPAGAASDIRAWWAGFNDPLLTELVERARTDNLDIAQAVARLRQAREALIQSRASLLPSLSGNAGYTKSFNLRGGQTSFVNADGTVSTVNTGGGSNFSLGGDAQYQADIFGGVSRTIEASRAGYAVQGFTYANTVISTEAEIARNYMLARLYQQQLANAGASLAIQDDNLQIAGWRVQAGLVSSLDAEQARASRAQTAAGIPAIEANYNSAVSRLGVLTGQAPGALKERMAAVQPIPVAPEVAVGIPADALRQRPDVRAAERSLAQATAQIGVAQAQLYPALAISGSVNTNAGRVGSILDTITGSLFAGLTQTIFDGGRLRAQVRSDRAAADGAFALYKSTVLTALEDIENAIVALHAAQERGRQYVIAYDAANNSAILARSQYRSGLTDFTTLNTQEASLVSARDGLAQARADEATARVGLYLALGGGWDAGTTPDAASVPAATPNPTQDR